MFETVNNNFAMRNLIFSFCLCVVVTGSAQTKQTDVQFVNSFVKEWIESIGSEDCALKYLEIHNSYLQNIEKKKFFFEWFSLFSRTINQEIIKNNGNYQIIPHVNPDKNAMIKEFNLIADDYSGVFYLIIGDKVVTDIIVKDSKIISYCPVLNQGKKINKAWFVNRPLE